MSDTTLKGTNFKESTLDNSDFSGARFDGDCHLSEKQIKGIRFFSAANFPDNLKEIAETELERRKNFKRQELRVEVED